MQRLNDEDENSLESPQLQHQLIDLCGFGYFQYALLTVCALANASDAVELLSISFILPKILLQFNASDGEKSALVAISFVGLLIGGLACGAAADKFGRKKSLIFALGVNGIFGLASAFTSKVWALVLMRFLSGVGIGGSIPVVFTYFSEFLNNQKKARWVVYLSLSWMFGSIYAAFIAWCTLEKEYSIDSWRVYLVVCSIPALAAASSLFFFPESPEFYIMSGNTKKAFESFRSVCTWNGTEISEDLLFAETETLPIRRNSKPASSFSYREVLDKIMQLFSEEYRKLTLMSCAVWITISFAYYGYTTWQPQYLLSRGINDDNDGIQLYLSTLIITVFQLPGSLLSALSVDYFGRKKTLSASLFLSALAMLGIFLTGSAKGVFILACAYSLVSVGSWNMLNVLSSELFAPEVRATGYGVSAAAGRIGGILGTALFGVLSGSWAVLLCVCSLFVGSVSSYYLSKK